MSAAEGVQDRVYEIIGELVDAVAANHDGGLEDADDLPFFDYVLNQTRTLLDDVKLSKLGELIVGYATRNEQREVEDPGNHRQRGEALNDYRTPIPEGLREVDGDAMKDSDLAEIVADLGTLFEDGADPSNEKVYSTARQAWNYLQDIMKRGGMYVHDDITLSAYVSELDGVRVVQLDTTPECGEFRVTLNDAAIWHGDPEAGESRHEEFNRLG